MWKIIDWVAHLLYAPTMLGRRSARARWHHRIHLIPGRLFERVCAWCDWAACPHEGDRPILIESTWHGGIMGVAPYCPRCGFRSCMIEDDDGRDITAEFVVSSTPSTWAAWDARWPDDEG